MELFTLLENLEKRIETLLVEREGLLEESLAAERLRVENRALQEELEQERQTRQHIQTRISSVLGNLAQHVDKSGADQEPTA